MRKVIAMVKGIMISNWQVVTEPTLMGRLVVILQMMSPESSRMNSLELLKQLVHLEKECLPLMRHLLQLAGDLKLWVWKTPIKTGKITEKCSLQLQVSINTSPV